MAESTLYEYYKNKVALLTEANDNQELVEVYSYIDKNHFEKLWKFPHPEKPILLVVWDGIPDRESVDKVKTKKYITPIDWAVGFSLHIKNSSPEIYPDLRILILDEKINRNPDSVSLKSVYQSPVKNIISMPWIRIFSLQQNNVLDRFLENLYSDAVATTNLLKDSSRSTNVSIVKSENEELTQIQSDQDTAVTESQFFGLNIDVIYRNIRSLVDSFRGSVEVTETSSVRDDKALKPSHDSKTTQPDAEICDVPIIPSMKDVLDENHDLDSIKNLWSASLTSPEAGYHHAIANLVGALLLMGGIGEDLHVNALQRLMRSIELFPEEDENKDALLTGNNSWINWDYPEWQWRLGELGKTDKKLKLILIDDMFKVGWGEILCRAVGVDYKEPSVDNGNDQLVKISNWNVIGKDEKVVVKAASSAAWIIKELEGFNGEDKRFDLTLDDDGVGQEILFLDLRLYPGRESEEVKFYQRLIGIAAKFKNSDKLPWPGFTDNEISKVNQWLKKPDPDRKLEEEGHTIALTLLPRILALTDLSLPIVLFSSTGRRDITEKLKHYGNIITVFEKPRFTVDIPIDIAWQTKCKFQDAMKKALQILQARQKIQKISTYKIKDQPKFEGSGIHVELFIDETYETSVGLKKLPHSAADLNTNTEKFRGIYHENSKLVYRKGAMNKDEEKRLLDLSDDSKYRKAINYLYKNSQIYVGGVFAIFSGKNNEAAQEKADDFDNDLVNKGVRYFDSLGYGVAPKKIKDKKDSSVKELYEAMVSPKNKPEALGFIRLGNLLCRDDDSKFDLFSPQSGDNHFRLTLEALIEAFLCETLPAHFEETVLEDISVSVFAGTRIKPYSDKDAGQMKELNESKYHLGMESLYNEENTLYSITRGSIYPIISDILSFHNNNRSVDRVSGIVLAYKSNKKGCRFPQYFVCRNCKKIISISKGDIKEKRVSGLQNAAKVVLVSKNNDWCKIRPIENQDHRSDIFVHFSDCPIVKTINLNTLVKYNSVSLTAKGLQSKHIELLSPSEETQHNNAELKYEITDLECGCKNKSNEFIPDYRALHYIADEILGHVHDVETKTGYGKSIKQILGGFDDILNDDLKNTITASRYLDLGETVSAIAEVKVTKDHSSGVYSVKPLLLQRIASKLDNLTGDEFSKLVQKENQSATLTRKNK